MTSELQLTEETDVNFYQDIKNYLITAVKAASYYEIQENTCLNDDDMEKGINIGLKAKGIEVYKENGYVKYRLARKALSNSFNPSPVSNSINKLSYFEKIDLMVVNALRRKEDITLEQLHVYIRNHFPTVTKKVVYIAYRKATK